MPRALALPQNALPTSSYCGFLKRILGHSDIKTTEIYVHQDDRDVKSKHAAASPVANLVSPTPSLPTRQAKIARTRAKKIQRPGNVVAFPPRKVS